MFPDPLLHHFTRNGWYQRASGVVQYIYRDEKGRLCAGRILRSWEEVDAWESEGKLESDKYEGA